MKLALIFSMTSTFTLSSAGAIRWAGREGTPEAVEGVLKAAHRFTDDGNTPGTRNLHPALGKGGSKAGGTTKSSKSTKAPGKGGGTKATKAPGKGGTKSTKSTKGTKSNTSSAPSAAPTEDPNFLLRIPDLETVTFDIEVSDEFAGCTVTDVNFAVDITHTFIGDLDIFLEHAPSGVSVLLFGESADDTFSTPCGSDDDLNVIFDDSGVDFDCSDETRLSGNPTKPFDESGAPTAMSSFNGIDPSGIWTLRIDDQFGGDSGGLNSVALAIEALCDNIATEILIAAP